MNLRPNFYKTMVRWCTVLAAGLVLGCVAHLAVLGLGVFLMDRAEQRQQDAVKYSYQEVAKTIPLIKHGSRRLAKDWVLILKPGQPETWRCLVKVTRRRGREFSEVVKRLRRLQRAVPMEVLIGKSKEANPVYLPKISHVLKTLDIVATAYDPGPVDRVRGNVGTTSIGERARFGIVAVDPKVIPYRSLLYIEGYGAGWAADTGGAIRGHRVDLCYNSTREAKAWGRRKVKVYVLGYPSRTESKLLREALKP